MKIKGYKRCSLSRLNEILFNYRGIYYTEFHNLGRDGCYYYRVPKNPEHYSDDDKIIGMIYKPPFGFTKYFIPNTL